jgi:glyoxylase-like metal-dependent hydrolase (beta-lactamase superfamily II)
MVDPGPIEGPGAEAHFDALVGCVQQLLSTSASSVSVDSQRKFSHVLVTHRHADHYPLTVRITQRFAGLQVVDTSYEGNELVVDDDMRFELLRTPGHTPDHVCFVLKSSSREGEPLLLCGDHVMGWSSTVVIPPLGDMVDYMNSLVLLYEYLRQHGEQYTLVPTHGPVVPHQSACSHIAALYAHRSSRHSQVRNMYLDKHVENPRAIAEVLYANYPASVLDYAACMVEAHLKHVTQTFPAAIA